MKLERAGLWRRLAAAWIDCSLIYAVSSILIGATRLASMRVSLGQAGLAGNRATQDGVLIITSGVHRTQEANRIEARVRLNELVASAQVVPKTRRTSRPTLGTKIRRLTAKSQRSSSKKLRGRANDD